ncbi:E3 ubiquitin-protein ligase CHIP isoform X2 [Elaeis guineensis]|uniref:E3 ubiquitin-protein ligase CHIP n=1 Tax=Elaeis guineensis var. tenera TaxID=51953 RepID=A0A6I9QGE0_ELAGV|nr:E3 ubiquitin-protein ligase CHIP isoform X2 [Elaeis guineensis]
MDNDPFLFPSIRERRKRRGERERGAAKGRAAMAPLPVPASVAKQAEQLKQDGNSYFKKERLGAAIDAYTEAITLCPDVAIYWTNRALCYRKRNEWKKVEEDCRRALQLDSNSVKAHYMLGLALLEKHDYSGGIKELEKVLSRAKYMEWEDSSSKRASRLQNLREVCEKALIDYYFIDASEAEDSSKESDHSQSQQLEYLREVFNKAAQADTPSEVPDHLCCKITLDIFRDPVITPSGITYERAVLLDHLQKVGKFDPVTRELLEPHQLVPNLAIKEAVQAFLRDHGWAYKMS